jgi:holo-[acyl-carrier protein] synthase
MSIIGIGIDATDIPRIERSIARFGNRFLQRVFTDGEIVYCSAKYHSSPSYAARFSAKEAAMKALGTGHAQGVLWKDIEVIRGGGPPRLVFHGGARRRFAHLGATSSLLTITHSDTLAMAQVMLLGGGPEEREE